MEELVNYVKSLQNMYEKNGFVINGDQEMALISNGVIKGAIEFDSRSKQYYLGVWDEVERKYTSWRSIKDY